MGAGAGSVRVRYPSSTAAAAPSAWLCTTGRLGGARLAGHAGCEDGQFLGQFFGAATGAGGSFPITGAHQYFAVFSAFLAVKLVNRHGYSVVGPGKTSRPRKVPPRLQVEPGPRSASAASDSETLPQRLLPRPNLWVAALAPIWDARSVSRRAGCPGLSQTGAPRYSCLGLQRVVGKHFKRWSVFCFRMNQPLWRSTNVNGSNHD